jgi:CRISPR system Cascade subunit CasD
MRSVLLRLEGPMQSWGTQSRFKERGTDTEPSKSGVVGLVAAARGIRRDEDERVRELGGLAMAVRVDREGTVRRDYHTAGGGTWPGRDSYGVADNSGKLQGTVLSNRYYLADASFLVALGGENGEVVDEIAAALAAPVFPLFLGRRSFAPAVPVLASPVPVELDPETAVRRHPWRPPSHGPSPTRLRLVLEATPETGTPRTDVPLSFRSIDRRFARRFVRTEWVETCNLPVAEEERCTSRASS